MQSPTKEAERMTSWFRFKKLSVEPAVPEKEGNLKTSLILTRIEVSLVEYNHHEDWSKMNLK